MTSKRGESWLGGYVRRDGKGRKVYVIRKAIGGTRYEVSTRCHTERAALVELARFEADPAGYVGGGGEADRLLLDDKLLGRFLADHVTNSRPWKTRQRNLLAWWGDRLRGVDLRRATLRDHVLPALDGAPGRAPRVAVIKRLYSWLRERDEITAAQDPTLGKLKMPQGRVAQHERSKVIPAADYEAARKHLVGAYRDALDVLAGTGWHTTEVERFAKGGTVEAYRGGDPDAAAVLVVVHKSGAPHRTAVTAEVADAARRLRKHDGLSLSRFHRAILAACDAAGVERFRPGWFRHTIATLATEHGQAEQVPSFLGHRSATTTRRHYAVLATPPRVRTLR